MRIKNLRILFFIETKSHYCIKKLSINWNNTKLTKEFGKDFSETNLEQIRKFFKVYGIPQTVSEKFQLSWSHYLILMRIENINARNFYEIEAFFG